MMQRRSPARFLLAVAIVVACTFESNEGDEGGAPPSSSRSGAEQPPPAGAEPQQPAQPQIPVERPTSRTDTLFVEGMPEPVELTLVRSPAGFPLPFTTYTTGDFVVEAVEQDGDAAVRFIAVFGGVRNDSAYLEVTVYPPGLTEADAVARADRAMGEGAEMVPPAESRTDWAIRRWRLFRRGERGVVLGFAALGHHGGRYFRLLARYPGDYADGFGPRAAVIRDHWRWDDGVPLTAPGAG